MVPDYALIGEIMFFAYGFEHAKECGAKMVTTFKLCSEQLSAQAHYGKSTVVFYDYIGKFHSLSDRLWDESCENSDYSGRESEAR